MAWIKPCWTYGPSSSRWPRIEAVCGLYEAGDGGRPVDPRIIVVDGRVHRPSP